MTRPLLRKASSPGIEAAIPAAHRGKEKTMTKDNTASRPTHRIYAVAKRGDKTFWQEIGAAWSHKDGKGFNLKLDYLPLNGADLVLREAKADDDLAATGA